MHKTSHILCTQTCKTVNESRKQLDSEKKDYAEDYAHNARKEIVKNLLDKNIDVNIISETTGIILKDVERIKQHLEYMNKESEHAVDDDEIEPTE